MPPPPPLPPIATQPLSVLLLARDAAAHVDAVVSRWATFLDGLGRDYELILVDDGSRDGTAEKAQALAERYPRLRLLRHELRQGEGAALRTGVAAAGKPLLFYTLCDPVYRPADLRRLLEKQLPGPPPEPEIDHVHLVSGCRAGRPVPAALRALGAVWRVFCRVVFTYSPAPLHGWRGWRGQAGRLLARAAFGVRYQDVACPFRLLRREVFERLPIQSDGPFAHVEVLAKANFLGCVMGEELPLDVAAPAYRGDWGAIRKEAVRVFRHPDFGPPPPKPA